MQTLLWYDYETFTARKPYRIAQFACVRTDLDLNPVEDPVDIFCSPTPDYLPDPDACLIHGITPQYCLENGLSEFEFAKTIHAELSRPNTCSVGFNAMNFDHEVSNYLFYRTLFDPYKWFWDNDNTKWDIIDLARAFYALRPDGVKWPMKEGGGPSFRLGDLCEANEIPMVQAHDAVSDVIATFELARVLKRAQPRLFNYYFSLRSKHAVNQFIRKGSRIVHVNSFIPAVDGCVGVYYVLGRHPVNSNSVIAVNLLEDLAPFSDLSPEEISACLYKKKVDQAPGEKRPPLTDVKTNKSPFVAEYRTLSQESKQRFNIDDDVIEQREQFIRDNPALQSRILKSYTVAEFPAATDVDVALYDGFIPKNDGWLLSEINAAPTEHLNLDVSQFRDKRLPELVKRFFARSFLNELDTADGSWWESHCRDQVFSCEELSASVVYLDRIQELKDDPEHAGDLALLTELEEYERLLRTRLGVG